jgi:hypothetical protein
MAAAIETIRAGDSIDTRVKKIIVFSLDCLEDQVCVDSVALHALHEHVPNLPSFPSATRKSR